MAASTFKVIVVGGGPVGLVAAHALTQAGIDFVLLESRPQIVIDAGSNLVLQAIGLRVLGQLGLLDALYRVSSPLGQINRFDHNGRDIGSLKWFTLAEENHGCPPRAISRHDLTKVLYDALPQDRQACMFAGKRVSDISTTPNGVVVNCRDGTSYEGSIVVGADGAHSMVRECMRTLALESLSESDSDSSATDAKIEGVNEEQPFLTTYRCLWVRFPTQGDIRPGVSNETHGRNAAVQLFAGEDTTVIGVYERMDKPTRDRIRFTSADEEALVGRWGHLPISKTLTIRDAYERRVRDGGAGMISLEEGVVDHWSWGSRIVLAGDAAHKFTPSTGAGCNNGIVDVVTLANELHKTFQQNAAPSEDQIALAFQQYQAARYGAVEAGCANAGQATATATWENQIMRFVDRHVLASHTVQRYFYKRAAPVVAQSPVFNYIEGEEQLIGKVAWVQPIRPRTAVRA